MFIGPEAFTATQALVACDSCGAVAVAALAGGWRSYTDLTAARDSYRAVVKHHCPTCAEFNEHIRSGLAYGVDPATAVTYRVDPASAVNYDG